MPRFSNGATPMTGGPHSRRRSTKKMSSKGNPKKITIKPFSKPPQLPPNFYETTSKQLLEATQAVFVQHTQFQDNTPASPPSTSSLSQQNSYSSVVDLVNHQYGTRLYQDLKLSMKEAAKQILGDVKSSSTLLAEVQQKYTVYVDYVLLCRHVFLHLDQTHIWQNGTVVKRSGGQSSTMNSHAAAPSSSASHAAAGGGLGTPTGVPSSPSGTASPQSVVTNGLNMLTTTTPMMTNSTLWDIGLAQFKERLLELKLDSVLFANFWQDLWRDWSCDTTTTTTTSNSSTANSSFSTSVVTDRFLLGKLIKMWQDLGMLPQILLDLQLKLEHHLNQVSLEWRSQSPYMPLNFLRFVHEKWWHVSTKWTFLPRSWLRTLVEMRLLKPHMTDQYLFHHDHFDDIVEEQDQNDSYHHHHRSTSSSTSKSTATSLMPSLSTSSQQQQQQQQHVSSISTLWMLAARIQNGLPQVTAAICNYGRRKGLALVKPPTATTSAGGAPTSAVTPASLAASVRESQKNMIPQLLLLYSKLDRLVSKLHLGSSELGSPLKHVWDDILNDNPSVAEYLAKHVDSQFRNTKLQNSPKFQERCMQLFCHLQAKDIYEAFYKRDLAKRLLLGKVVSMDVERSMVTLLKAECGAGYTSKMEGMFQDVEWSRETMARYKQSQSLLPLEETCSNVDMEVQVLTTGYWPVYPQYANLIIPAHLQLQQERFWNHYKTKYQGRRMTWQYALGNCSVKAMFGTKKYELVVSLCQALVLLCFNEGEEKGGWTLPQIMAKTGLDDRSECERLLQSLSLGKDGTRVLRKSDYVDPTPPTTTSSSTAASTTPTEKIKKKKPRLVVGDRDIFTINEKFESRMRKIKINNIQWKETKEERDKMVEGVSRDRLYLMDAVLVRIMKARKTILHQQLIPQVLEQVKVPAQPSDIKKRIESLIEREYMERDEQDRNRYKYLA